MSLKCWDCGYQKQASKSPAITPGGETQYIVTCLKEYVTFEICLKSSPSDLPCWVHEDDA